MGTAKRFIMEKGFGFITPDTGGDDLFIHSSNLLDGNALREGARVCFRPSYDHQKNKPIAEEVTGGYIDPSRPPPKNMPGGSAPIASTPQARGAPPGEAPPPAGKVMGTVKRFVMEKGYGFIAPDSGGDDVFVHGNNLLDGNALREGSRICYRSAYDNVKNKPTAEEVTGAYTDNNRPIRIVTAAGGASLGSAGAATHPASADLQPPAQYAMPPMMPGVPPVYQQPFAMPPLDYSQLSQFAAYQPPAQYHQYAALPFQPPSLAGYAAPPPYGAQPPPAA
jgi:cold shock CspA family protein